MIYQNFNDLQYFLLFLGRGRSGSSLCGGLLSCHPDMAILHEKEFIEFEYKNETELYNYLLDFMKYKRHIWKPLRNRDDWNWIDNYRILKVLGTKKQGTLVKNVRNFKNLEKLKRTLTVPIKFINIYRNPFDNIATVYRKSQVRKHKLVGRNMKSINRAITYYFTGVKVTQEMIDRGEDVLNIKHEDLVKDTKRTLAKICLSLNVFPYEEYLDYCKELVWDNPRKTRDRIDWSESDKKRVIKLKNQYDFLREYTWKN